MMTTGWVLVALPLALAVYAYVGYPLLLKLAGAAVRKGYPTADPAEWPTVSISLPAYNEEARIAATVESLVALEYPRDRLQILVVSDASTDRTDEIVRGFAGRGVELLRLPERGGKTAAESAAAPRLRGELVVNTDASVHILPDSLKPLIRAFQDPKIGCASGRDVSVGAEESDANLGESGYVGYEMWVRSLETRAGSIVGASGCYYAIRKALHTRHLPDHLSRDFAAALVTREAGLRAVSVDDAVCLVPRTASLRREYRRKVRTMARGLETLWYLRRLLNPFRYGSFALMLFSHKVCRWLVPPALVLGAVGLGLLATEWLAAGVVLVAGLAVAGVGLGSLRLAGRKELPRPLELLAFLTGSQAAAVTAWWRAVTGKRHAVWEPTRRGRPGQADSA